MRHAAIRSVSLDARYSAPTMDQVASERGNDREGPARLLTLALECLSQSALERSMRVSEVVGVCSKGGLTRFGVRGRGRQERFQL
jgi:hypothetical protein